MMRNWADFIATYMERVYCMWVYKRMFTPREQAEKYIDESCFEDNRGNPICICEAYELPDKDILLGVRTVINKEAYYMPKSEWIIEYYKLSEIRLRYDPTYLRDILEE